MCQCNKDRKQVQYPYEATLKDGSKAMVSSAADLHSKNRQAQTRMRQDSVRKGYTASRG